MTFESWPRREGSGWHGAIDGMFPVIAYGRVDDHPWFFRARGEGWSMEIADDRLREPSIGGWGSDCGRWWANGEWSHGAFSPMPDEVVWELVEQTIAAFRAGALRYVPAGELDPS